MSFILSPIKKMLRYLRKAWILAPALFLVVAIPSSPLGTALNFRLWEGMSLFKEVDNYGPFYPNQTMTMVERPGILQYRYSEKATLRLNTWHTDAYGLRNRPEIAAAEKIDTVISGASNTVGAFLDQDETISEVLSELCACVAYNWSVARPRAKYFADPRFIANPPRAFVSEARLWEMRYVYPSAWLSLPCRASANVEDTNPKIQRFLMALDLPTTSSDLCRDADFLAISKNWEVKTDIDVVIDRLQKNSLYRALRSRMGLAAPQNKELLVDPMTEARLDGIKISPEETAKYYGNLILNMNEEAKRRSAAFVLLLIPAPYGEDNYPVLQQILNKNVAVSHFLGKTDDGAWRLDNPPGFWFEQDGHWRPESVKRAAQKVLHQLARKDPFFSAEAISQRRRATAQLQ